METGVAYHKERSRIAFSIMGVLAALFAILACVNWYFSNQATNFDSGMAARAIYVDDLTGEAYSVQADGIDWDYWKGINPDVVGWLTVPGTSIDHPIVQAHPDDPTYYLTHDVYRNWNYHGAVYLHADCIDKGMDSRNAYVYAHNMGFGNNSMFGEFSRFTNLDYALDHQIIIVQTPDWGQVTIFDFSEIVEGTDKTKRTSFNDEQDFVEWYRSRMNNASVQFGNADEAPVQNFTWVTCSYNYWSNERTLTYSHDPLVEQIPVDGGSNGAVDEHGN